MSNQKINFVWVLGCPIVQTSILTQILLDKAQFWDKGDR